jgi:hypothetical protein
MAEGLNKVIKTIDNPVENTLTYYCIAIKYLEGYDELSKRCPLIPFSV